MLESYYDVVKIIIIDKVKPKKEQISTQAARIVQNIRNNEKKAISTKNKKNGNWKQTFANVEK